MAVLTRVNGSVFADQFQGRKLTYVQITGTGLGTNYNAVGSNFETIIRALEGFMFITIIFTPDANNVIVACENTPSDFTAATAAVNSAQSIQVTMQQVATIGATWGTTIPAPLSPNP